MSQIWHYSINGEQAGPISAAELKQLAASGQLTKTDLVWKDGLANWVPAAKLKGLFDHPVHEQLAQTTAPVAEATSGVAPAASQQVNPYAPPTQASLASGLTDAQQHVVYAGFTKRLLAAFVDFFVNSIIAFAIGFVLGFAIVAGGGTDDPVTLNLIGNILGIVVAWLYYALMESSSLQGTVGKLAIGIKVTDMHGNRISFLRATGRHFGKIISGLLMGIGFLMAGFTEKKQALHDLLANCLVVMK